MNSLSLVLVRHGETEANKADILQGHHDFPLTDAGVEQAHLVGKALRNVQWDCVFASDLTRASRTCRILLKQQQQQQQEGKEAGIETTPLVREVHYGVRETLPSGTTTEEARKIVAERTGIDEKDVVDTAETPEQVRERQAEFLQRLTTKFAGRSGANEAKVLCVSHGGFIKRFLDAFCNHSIKKIHNCSISLVKVTWGEDGTAITCVTDEEYINFVEHISTTEAGGEGILYPHL